MQTTPFKLSYPLDKPIHFVGIGGTGMSGLAKCFVELNYQVTGSDLQSSEVTERLSVLGVKIHLGHQPQNLPHSCGLVVRSAAIPDDNPEIQEAWTRGIPVIKYAQLLGHVMAGKFSIAVSGSHGKTTTSALISYMLHKAGYDPSFVIGGYIPILAASGRIGKGNYFVAEACEYDRSFHNLTSSIGIILNLEPDHLDYYKHLSKLIDAFRVFAAQIPVNGYLIANAHDKNISKCLKFVRCPVIKFTTSSNLLPKTEWRIGKITAGATMTGGLSFEAIYNGQPYGNFSLGIQGQHNLNNALVAIIISYLLKIDRSIVQQALSEFNGVSRRFELVGKMNNVTVLDDYAHHPTELAATIRTAQETYPNRHIWYIFQPHQYHRTRVFLNEFASTFATLHNVIIANIFLARDSAEEQKKVTALDLVKKINQLGGQAKYLPTFDEIIRYLKQNINSGDVVITLGAGDIYKVARSLRDEATL
jgi:UDP-N-acetylmuramate--alanine ligase